jgi:ABC-type Na+ efflux pump permease subunit
MWVIAKKDILESLRNRSVIFYVAILFFLMFSFFGGYGALVSRLTAANATQPEIIQANQSYLNSIASTLPLIGSLWICTIFATYAVIVEKAKRNIESLMAAPVSLNQIWMGKALAVTLPSAALGLVVSANYVCRYEHHTGCPADRGFYNSGRHVSGDCHCGYPHADFQCGFPGALYPAGYCESQDRQFHIFNHLPGTLYRD